MDGDFLAATPGVGHDRRVAEIIDLALHVELTEFVFTGGPRFRCFELRSAQLGELADWPQPINSCQR